MVPLSAILGRKPVGAGGKGLLQHCFRMPPASRCTLPTEPPCRGAEEEAERAWRKDVAMEISLVGCDRVRCYTSCTTRYPLQQQHTRTLLYPGTCLVWRLSTAGRRKQGFYIARAHDRPSTAHSLGLSSGAQDANCPIVSRICHLNCRRWLVMPLPQYSSRPLPHCGRRKNGCRRNSRLKRRANSLVRLVP